jgi:hypothetical protein
MADSLHPAASDHLPMFITPPGETDVLMVVVAVILLVSVIGFGVLFLTLHTLPERIAHKSHKLQFEIVAVLGLIALFTHMHIFWVIGLMLALIDFPDLGGWLGRIAGSVEKIADNQPAAVGAAPSEAKPGVKAPAVPIESSVEHVPSVKRGEGVASTKPELTPA